MSLRTPSRLSALGASFVALYFGFVACGSDDGTKHAMEDAAGEGGASGGEAPSSGGSKSTAGTAGSGGSSQGGLGGGSNGGAAGSPDAGGASGMTAIAGQGGAAGDGNPLPTAGAAGESGAAGAGGAAEVVCDPPSTSGSRITIGFDANNAEWVKNLQWLDSNSVTTANVAAYGGGAPCGDAAEFFGEAYGAPEGTTPSVVVGGSRSTSVACGSSITITSTPNDCGNQPQIPTTTEYLFYGGTQASQLRVTRTIGFDQNSPKFTGTGVRPWQARVGLAAFANVIYPNAAETAVTTKAAISCPGDCLIATGANWSGRWFADVTAAGLAIIVLRDSSMVDPVDLTINYDSYSNANLASFVLLQPQDGWKAPVTEVEYLCFADLTSWPQTQRDAAQLPAGCGP